MAPTHRPLSTTAVAALGEFELADELYTRVSDLSYGHRRLAAIARTIAVEPSILLLDEPAAGLSAVEADELAAIISRLARMWGMGILVVEHQMPFVMSVCNRIVVLDFGKQIAEGTPSEVRSNPLVISAYLGEDEKAAPGPSPRPRSPSPDRWRRADVRGWLSRSLLRRPERLVPTGAPSRARA